jgi:RHS repeat-associated protein
VNPTGYPQVFDELTNGVVTRTYTYGLQRIDEEQLVDNAWVTSYYGYDGFGTVRQLTNASGAVTDTYEYDAFGNEINHTGTTPNNYLYRGEQFDPDLGLYYLRARYYNPLTDRFMSRDPEDGDITVPASLHKYLYANGDPVNGIDPMGREDEEEVAPTDKKVALRVFIVAGACGTAARDIYKDINEALDDPEKEPPGSLLLDVILQSVGVCGGGIAGAFFL